MISALDSWLSGPGSSLGQLPSIVFLDIPLFTSYYENWDKLQHYGILGPMQGLPYDNISRTSIIFLSKIWWCREKMFGKRMQQPILGSAGIWIVTGVDNKAT